MQANFMPTLFACAFQGGMRVGVSLWDILVQGMHQIRAL